MKSNNFAMKEWHLEHMKVVVHNVKGISRDVSSFENPILKNHSSLYACAKQIQYYIKHGLKMNEALSVIRQTKHHKEFRSFNQII
jgi:type II secretory pathway component PulF